MKILRYLLVVLFFISCSSRHGNGHLAFYQTLSSYEVQTLLTNDFPVSIAIVSDDNYVLPTEDWVKTKFMPEFDRFLFNNGVKEYRDAKNDCDDFSLYGCTVARLLNNQSARKEAMGIAVGEAHLLMNDLSGHAVNFIITANEQKKISILFYDVQTRQLVPYTNFGVAYVLHWRL